MLAGLTVARIALPRTIRLVSSARLRASVLRSLVEEDELGALAEIEGATSGRRIAETRGTIGIAANALVHGMPHAAHINAAFVYPRPRAPNRFNGPERGAWYAALELETSLAEVSFHLTAFLSAAGRFEAVVDYAEMFASFAGEFVDLRTTPDHPALAPDVAAGYPAGNTLADAVRGRGLNGIVYPSVRRPSGLCIAALFPHAVQSVAQGDVYRLRWQGTPEPVVETIG